MLTIANSLYYYDNNAPPLIKYSNNIETKGEGGMGRPLLKENILHCVKLYFKYMIYWEKKETVK